MRLAAEAPSASNSGSRWKIPKWLWVVGVFAVLLMARATAAEAAALDFGIIAPTVGSISYAGGLSPLLGSGISVDNVVGLGTSLNNGVTRNCLGCFLSFTTGPFSGFTATTWTFGGGPTTTIAVTGCVDLNNNTICDGGDPTGTLLTGTFGTATVTSFGGTFKIAGASFNDFKDANLLAFYGLPDGTTVYSGNFNISFNAAGSPPGAFSSTQLLSGDLINTPVPEPSSALLLGSSLLLSLGVFKRGLPRAKSLVMG